MEHSEAVRLKAAEKYIAGELLADLRDQFEEHYFDCLECANDLKALATFVTASRMVLEEEVGAKIPRREPQPERTGWFNWLRPLVAVPALAALALVVIIQNAVTIPSLKKQVAVAQVYETSFRVQGATRGDTFSKVVIRADEGFALDFDFTPAQTFTSYEGRLLDDAGSAVLTFALPGGLANKEVHLVIPAGRVHTGNYSLVFSGVRDAEGRLASGSASAVNEVQRVAFAVEFRP